MYTRLYHHGWLTLSPPKNAYCWHQLLPRIAWKWGFSEPETLTFEILSPLRKHTYSRNSNRVSYNIRQPLGKHTTWKAYCHGHHQDVLKVGKELCFHSLVLCTEIGVSALLCWATLTILLSVATDVKYYQRSTSTRKNTTIMTRRANAQMTHTQNWKKVIIVFIFFQSLLWPWKLVKITESNVKA